MRAVLVLVMVAALSCPGLAATLPPVEAFGRTPEVSEVVLSPNGSFLAWADVGNQGPIVSIYDIAQRKILRTIRVGDRLKLRNLQWADDATVLVDVSFLRSYGPATRDTYEVLRTIATDVAGGAGRIMLMNDAARELVTAGRVLEWRITKPRTIIMASWDYTATAQRNSTGSRLIGGRRDAGWVYNLYEVNLDSGRGKLIEGGTPYTQQWVVDHDGKAVARCDWQADQKLYRVYARDGLSWREIHRQTDGEVLDISGLSQDGKSLVAIGANGQPHARLWALPLDGSGAKVLIEDTNNDVVSIIKDRFTGAPVGVTLGGSDVSRRWLDPKAESRQKALEHTFPDRFVTTYGRSEDNQRVIARVSSPSHPAIYYLIDYAKKTADIAGEEYPKLADVALGEVRSIRYKARDGYDIPAYLTLPPGRTATNLPLIVMPHGGPEARDGNDFDWWSQFLATRGYAVLRPQFRGSTGFGEAHRAAGVHQWGKRMQDDVSDGVKAMIEQKIADLARVCIVGASYGGYAALAGAAFTPELYACAVSVAGVSDLPIMIGDVKQTGGDESDSLAYWRSHIGSPFDADVIAKSPARKANGVRAPVLLIHGVDDTVVPISQSETMAKALQEAQKTFSFVRLENEDHWLSRSATRTRLLQELDGFLAKYLPVAAKSSP